MSASVEAPKIYGGVLDEKDVGVVMYEQLRHVAGYLATQGKKLTLQCGESTFTDHFDTPLLIAGPWAWDISEEVPRGTLLMRAALAHEVNEVGEIIGRLNIHDGVIWQ